jgi:hypothetical protein
MQVNLGTMSMNVQYDPQNRNRTPLQNILDPPLGKKVHLVNVLPPHDNLATGLY